MATEDRSEWSFFQIPHVGVPEPDRDSWARDDTSTTIRRPLDMKMSYFRSNFVGPRMAQGQDYTRTELFFKDKDNLSDISVLTEDSGMGYRLGLRGVTIEENPYVWGSTVKRVRDDQFFRMTMDNNTTGNEVEQPSFDVMDTDAVTAEGMVALSLYKNYPTEGWRSFGGKYDFLPYTGVLGKPRGNG